jgi:hypothetical protein
MATTFLDLLNAIKEEGRVDRSTDLDAMIKRIINEVMIKHTRNKEYPDLYVPGQAITIGANKQASFTLPTDFAKVKEVMFSSDGTSFRFLKKKNQYGVPYLTGMPSWWYIAGNQLYIYPYDHILTTHTLTIGYFKLPAALVNDGDTLIVDDLYPIIVNEALSRVRRYHNDLPGDQAYAKDAKEAATTVDE